MATKRTRHRETDPPDEQLTGECPHHCNGDHIRRGQPSAMCDWKCHPGLTADPERAARYDDLADEWHDAEPGSEIAARGLHEHLGMTRDEYALWVVSP